MQETNIILMNNMLLTRSHTNTQTFSAFIKNNETYFQNSFLYKIHFTVSLDKNLLSENNLYSLKSFVRLLINGKQTVDATSNREWFSLNFLGGFYKINITQPSPEELPEIHYHIICFSQSEDLEEIIAPDLLIRSQKIVPNVEINEFRGNLLVWM